MPSQSSTHFIFDWTKARIDEMDAALASLKGRTMELHAKSRPEAENLIAELGRSREEFSKAARRYADVTEAEWDRIRGQLEKRWVGFEAQFKKYFESFGEQIKQQETTFQDITAAQIKACRQMADRIQEAATKFGADHRADIDTIANRMKSDAAEAQARIQKLSHAGAESWTAFNGALGEARAAFDRAHEAARDAFKRIARPSA